MRQAHVLRWFVLLGSFCVLPYVASAAALFEPEPLDGKTYTESWASIARLENGAFLHVSFLISNAGLSSGKGMCRAKWVDRGGRKWVREIVVDRDGWQFSPTTGLHIGDCTLRSRDNQTTLEMPFKEGPVRLVLQGTPKPVPMPPQRVEHGSRFYGSEVLLPFAHARLSMADGAAPESTVSGDAFLDHTRSTTLPADAAYGWVRFRGFAPGCGRLVLSRYVKKAEGTIPAVLETSVWKEGEAGPTVLKAPRAALPEVGATAESLRLTLFDDAQAVGTLQASRQLWHEAPFEEHGMLGRLVGAFVGTVQMEAFEATYEDATHAACAKVPGIWEIDHNQ